MEVILNFINNICFSILGKGIGIGKIGKNIFAAGGDIGFIYTFNVET